MTSKFEQVHGPGKFEGERLWVSAAWQDSLDGLWDEYTTGQHRVLHTVIDDEFRAAWEIPTDAYGMALLEEESGFVHGILYGEDAYAGIQQRG